MAFFAQKRMRDGFLFAFLPGGKEHLASFIRQPNCSAVLPLAMLSCNDFLVNAGQNEPISAHRAQLFHQSNARLVLPGRGRCKKPTYGSSPTLCNAAAHSLASNVYAKESTVFMGSSGGRRLRPVNANSVRCCKIRLSNPSKYRCAASPSNPRRVDALSHFLISKRLFTKIADFVFNFFRNQDASDNPGGTL